MSTIEITLGIRRINPLLLVAWTTLAEQDFQWVIDRTITLGQFRDLVAEDMHEVLGLSNNDRIVLRVRDETNYREELGLDSVMKAVTSKEKGAET